MKRLLMICMLFACEATIAFEIGTVTVNCEGEESCLFLKKNSPYLKRTYQSFDKFYEVFSNLLSRSYYSHFSYELRKVKNETYDLEIQTREKKKLIDFEVFGVKKALRNEILDVLRSSNSEYESEDILQAKKQSVLNYLRSQGYIDAEVGARFIGLGAQKVGLILEIAPGKIKEIIKRIDYQCGGEAILRLARTEFTVFEGKRFIASRIDDSLQSLKANIRDYGFYFSNPDLKETVEGVYLLDCGNLDQVVLKVDKADHRLSKTLIHYDFKSFLKSKISEFSLEKIRLWFSRYIASLGYIDKDVLLQYTKKEDKDYHSSIHYLEYKTKNLKKIKVTRVEFSGNDFFSDEELESKYRSFGDVFLKNKIFNEKAIKKFESKLQQVYIKNGFLSAQVFSFSTFSNKAYVRFNVREGNQSIIKELNVYNERGQNITKDFSRLSKIKKELAYNPYELEKSIKNFLRRYKSLGYSDAHLLSLDSEIVKFFRKDREVEVNFVVSLGRKKKIKNLTFFGLNKTKSSVLERKLNFVRGQYLTPQLLNDVSSSIANLSLFKSYDLKVIKLNESEVELVFNLTEKRYGLLEVSPGFRTDLGAKISTKYVRRNIDGRDILGSVSGLINYRPGYEGINDYRRQNTDRFPEFTLKSSINAPDFLKTYWDLNSSASFSRRRLFFVDADIFRFNNSFRKNLSRRLSFSLGYQFESIDQFNASPRTDGIDDNGKFRIGALVPSFVFDFRNNPVIPTKGAQFQFTIERATPLLGSQNDTSLKIDYTKFTVRKKLYVPIDNRFYIASSITFGIAQNHARNIKLDSAGNTILDPNGDIEREGFVPSVKVFRLSGVDWVRGYAEDEANMLGGTGQDISEFAIRDKVYMTNLKFEPRYKLNESIILGLFWDAGSVQQDTLRLLDLRSSVGLSLKYVTPVGTLDFDYGRKINPLPGESPGRFHLSIGFF